MKRSIPFDLVANWQPDRESILPGVAKDLAALLSVAAFCGLIGATAILFA